MGAEILPISLGLGAASTMTGLWQNERNIETQKNQNRLNRQWQSSENALDREFQAQQQESLLNSQQDFQREMFNLQNQYNLPANQIARLRSAGLNPAALLGGSGGLAAASGNSSSVPSVPSAPGAIGSHSVQQSPQIQTPMQSVSQMFSSLAQMQDSIAHSKKADADVTWMEQTLPEELEKLKATTNSLLAKARLDEATASVTEFNNKLQEMFGKDEKAAQIKKLMNDSYAAFAKGQYDEAQTIYSRGLSMLNELDYKFKDEQYPILLEQAKKYNIVLDEQAKSERAKQANEYASASEHKAGAGLKIEEANKIRASVDSYIDNIKADTEQKKKMKEQIEQVLKLNKPDEIEAAIESQMKGSNPAATGLWLMLRGLLKALPFSSSVNKSTVVSQ